MVIGNWRRWWALGVGVLALGVLCGVLSVSVGQMLLSPPEARPPYPNSELLEAYSEWNVRGLRTVRSYRVDSDIRAVIEWYRDEGGGASARVPASVAARCSQNRITKSGPDLPFSPLTISLTTDVLYCPEGESVRVTTDTYYRWQYVGP